jgi:hypothetical protein
MASAPSSDAGNNILIYFRKKAQISAGLSARSRALPVFPIFF